MSDLKPIPDAPFIMFCRDGLVANIDFKDGKLDYSGDLPLSDAARMLFEQLGRTLPADWMNPAAARNAALEEAASRLDQLAEVRDKRIPYMSPSLAASERAEACALRTGASAIRALIERESKEG